MEEAWLHKGGAESRKREQNRLSQRRHPERLIQGAKVRQQSASFAHDPILPLHTLNDDEQVPSDGYLNSPTGLGLQDAIGDALMVGPAQHEWGVGNNIGTDEVGPSSTTTSDRTARYSRGSWGCPIRPMSSQTGVSVPGMPMPLQPDLMPLTTTPSTPTRQGQPADEYWDNTAVPELQWRDPGPLRPRAQATESIYGMVNVHTPITDSTSRTLSTCSPQCSGPPCLGRVPTNIQNQADDGAGSPSPEQRPSNPTCTNRKRLWNDRHGVGTDTQRSSHDVGLDQHPQHRDLIRGQSWVESREDGVASSNGNRNLSSSTLPRLQAQHSCCRCSSSASFSARPTPAITPSPPISSPLRKLASTTSCAGTPAHVDTSSDGSFTVRDLVRRNLPGPWETHIAANSSSGQRKSRKCISADRDAVEKAFLEDEVGKGQRVEKVVIVYLRNGDAVA
ncbi:MAG: hypothetical protein Q9188_001893 [Gyalolechia gomerana]